MRHSKGKTAAEFVPPHAPLEVLREALPDCRGCDLYLNATQAVAGQGPPTSRIVLVGEQPGDEEDREGQPFVGPAGRLLNRALEEAGIDRSLVYITNAVKHFKFEERGKRRLHKKPGARETLACRPWLQAEMEALRPQAIVCLGATAALSVFGADYRVTKQRGIAIPHEWAPLATSTIHPAAILRAPPAQREEEYRRFVEDLKTVSPSVNSSLGCG